MKLRRYTAFLLALVIIMSLLSSSALAASPYEQILAHNNAIYNAAETGDNARRYFLLPSPRIESDDPEIIALAEKITGGYTDDLAKTRAVHDWVCNNVWGDLDAGHTFADSPEQSALKTLGKGYAVCQGYANLTIALLRAAGIPAKFVIGRVATNATATFVESDVTASGNHVWVEALVGNRWVIIDTTWDSGNTWQNGRKVISTGMIDRMYFDISLESFSRSHRIDVYSPFFGADVSEDGTLRKYGGPGDDLPDTIITTGSYVFQECASFKRIVLPESMVSIGRSAFAYRRELKEVIMPTSLRVIGDSAFEECTALEEIHIPNGVTTISSRAFTGCTSLSSVYIPPTVTDIHDQAFYNNPSLTRAIIPATVTRIDPHSFGYLSYDAETRTFYSMAGFTIIGSPGSTAEEYAARNGFAFIALVATPTSSGVLVNGKSIKFDAYNIAGNNFFKLRDLAFVLSSTGKRFGVGWDEANNAIRLISGAVYTPDGSEMSSGSTGSRTPVPTSSRIFLDGKEVSLAAYNIGGNNYFKLRDIGAAFDFKVEWHGDNNTIVIDTNSAFTG